VLLIGLLDSILILVLQYCLISVPKVENLKCENIYEGWICVWWDVKPYSINQSLLNRLLIKH